jgi:hypothetical protein
MLSNLWYTAWLESAEPVPPPAEKRLATSSKKEARRRDPLNDEIAFVRGYMDSLVMDYHMSAL